MSGSSLPVRSPLDALQHDYPYHEITMRAIGGKLFYLAEAAEPGIRPSFAQAETTDRLRAKLEKPARPFSSTEPSIARVWDVLLGGKNNFAADRAQAARLLEVFPHACQLARESRQFQQRAVTYVAARGISQFTDIGCGLPTAPSTHETARGICPGAVTVYADDDEQVLSHARNILATEHGVTCIEGDIAYPDEITYDWRVRQVLDFHRPMCLVLTMTLHFFSAEAARQIIAQFTAAVPDGSYLIVSAGQLEGEPAEQVTRRYKPSRTYHHSREDVASFLRGLDLVEPGVTEARAWRAPMFVPESSRRGHIWAAVARKAAA